MNLSKNSSEKSSNSQITKQRIQHTIVDWTPDHENILVEWADKAMCYRWLHGKSHQHFSKANTWFTIPVIIMSTLTGTANFAQDKFEGATRELVTIIIGAVNIFAGILTTIQQFLKISELNEAHRVSSLSWDKFYRNIKVELAQPPLERTPVLQMLKTYKEDFDRLMEISPAISEKIAKKFTETFNSGMSKNKKIIENELIKRQGAFGLLKKPDICGMLESSINSVYKPDKKREESIIEINNVRSSITNASTKKKIETIIKQFQLIKLRDPTDREILDELDNIDITPDDINAARKQVNETVIDEANDENITIDVTS